MKKIKINLKFSFIYKLLSTLFCSLGLLFQCSQLLTQYFGNKTVVNIEVKRELYENLPAITVCIPRIVSIELVANYDQQYQQYYTYYQQLIKPYSENSTLYEKNENNITITFHNARQILNHILYEPNFLDIVIDNLSIPYAQDRLGLTIDGTLPGIISTACHNFMLIIINLKLNMNEKHCSLNYHFDVQSY